MPLTTRREALVTIAAGISARSLAAQGRYAPTTFSEEDFDLLGTLVDLILPESDTPGAREVGVHAMLDEDLARQGETAAILREGMERLRAGGFEGMDADGRIAVLARYSEADGTERTFFETLKGLTVDAYYSTETGLVEELGYQGNTYLADFPGCTHDHDLETAG